MHRRLMALTTLYNHLEYGRVGPGEVFECHWSTAANIAAGKACEVFGGAARGSADHEPEDPAMAVVRMSTERGRVPWL